MIINPKFRELQAMLVDYAGSRMPDRDGGNTRRIDNAVAMIAETHKEAPDLAAAQIRAAMPLCKSSPYMGALLTMMLDELYPPTPKAPVGKAPLTNTPRAPHMGAPTRPDTQNATEYWWLKI